MVLPHPPCLSLPFLFCETLTVSIFYTVDAAGDKCQWSCSVHNLLLVFSSVQRLSHVLFFATPWTAACQASLSITNSWSWLKLTSIESVMPSNHLILCHPLLLLPSIFPSIKVFSSESVLHIRWSEYWSFSFSISPFNEYSRLISLRIDWLDLLAVQGTLKSLLQHCSSKASILQGSAAGGSAPIALILSKTPKISWSVHTSSSEEHEHCKKPRYNQG